MGDGVLWSGVELEERAMVCLVFIVKDHKDCVLNEFFYRRGLRWIGRRRETRKNIFPFFTSGGGVELFLNKGLPQFNDGN